MFRSWIFLLVPLLAGAALGAATDDRDQPAVVEILILPPPPQTSILPETPRPFFSEEGLASWYRGKTTADGEPFRQNALTGAHRRLPFNTIVRVTDLGSGKAVKMRINDRGPFVKGRIVDLSRAAADSLGIAKSGGMHKVRLEVFAADQTLEIAQNGEIAKPDFSLARYARPQPVDRANEKRAKRQAMHALRHPAHSRVLGSAKTFRRAINTHRAG